MSLCWKDYMRRSSLILGLICATIAGAGAFAQETPRSFAMLKPPPNMSPRQDITRVDSDCPSGFFRCTSGNVGWCCTNGWRCDNGPPVGCKRNN